MSGAPIGPDQQSDSAPKGRRAAYTLIAVMIPVAFFALAEIVLRVTGIGDYPPLFVPSKNSAAFLQPNEAAMARFFAHPAQAPRVSIDTTYFAATKPDGTLRIVVQGGSSAAGFPYGKWASPAGMLKRRLRQSYPERDIEVISTAMSAVNSYALLDFADEIIVLDPDAVVIYAGHNEFLGVLGVGSAFLSSRSRDMTNTILKLRRLHVYRTLEKLIGAMRAGTQKPRSGTLMARIAGERNIPFGSPLYNQGVAQFRGNMAELLGKYQAAGVPVFVGTLASNERNQAPFTSEPAADTDGARWDQAYGQAVSAMERGDADAAIELLEQANDIDDVAADGWYLLAEARLNEGDQDGARIAYRAARDRDQLRFRAPTEFNDILRAQSAAFGATVVEVEAALAAASPGGVVGQELILEHLHPNVRGYFLLADAFFDALVEAGLAGPPGRAIDEQTAWRDRPVTEIDELAAGYRLAALLADWPFQEQKQAVSLPPAVRPVEQIAQTWYTNRLPWAEAMNRAMVHYQTQNDMDNAVRVALNLAEAFHFVGNIQFIAGQLLAKRGDAELALHYLERAVELEPNPQHQLALAQAYAGAGREEAARQALGRVLAREPDNEVARGLLDSLD